MGIMERPLVNKMDDGGKYWEHEYSKFFLKVYVPANDLDGQTNNYTFTAPLLVVFEENRMDKDAAIEFAKVTGLSDIAAESDASVLFVYPTCDGGWNDADESMYADLIGEVRMDPVFEDGIVSFTNFFTKTFMGYFIKGAKFRTDIYSYGASADYVARCLIKTIKGEFLWGPGEISPAMCSMERLSIKPDIQRNDIAILSVGNSPEINKEFKDCKYLLVKDTAEYKADFKSFVWKYKMWCNNMQIEPDLNALNMVKEPGYVTVNTTPNNKGRFKDDPTHKVGYFAFYNRDLFSNGSVPLFIGFHGGGDSANFFTYVSGWYAICHRHNFLYIAIENHMDVTAAEVMQVLEELKKRYSIDEKRIYAGGFSMGCGKSCDLYQEFPDAFAGFALASALFPVNDNLFSTPINGTINHSVSVPLFYLGGEKSPLVELPFQSETGLERIQYFSEVNKCRERFDVNFQDKDSWENAIWGKNGDRVEKIYDESRDSYLTVNYFDSEDGICRTAFASVSGQEHECREHSCENAWLFISKFTK